jgi:hypothetical protein
MTRLDDGLAAQVQREGAPMHGRMPGGAEMAPGCPRYPSPNSPEPERCLGAGGDAAHGGLEGVPALKEQLDESFRFMEGLVATWLEGAHNREIARILDAIKAELDRRGVPISPYCPRAPSG